MAKPHCICIFLILIQLFSIYPTYCQVPNFTAHYCFPNGNYTNTSTYKTNLDTLFSTLSNITQTNSAFFYNLTIGNDPNKVYATALCGGDVTPQYCQNCLDTSINNLPETCPTQKAAYGWYADCMLRYSNQTILGIRQDLPAHIRINNEKVTDNVNEFNQVLEGLLHSIQSEAASGDSELKFATGSSDYGDFNKIYGMMQCSPDLSNRDCFNCLGDFINILPGCCNNSVGVQINGPSCKIRYEDFLFYNNKTSSPPPSTPSGEATIITLENNCNHTVWPIIHGDLSTNVSKSAFLLHNGESMIVNVPSGWTGRIWGRTFCSTDKVTGNFSCLTGDCGTGKLDCQQHNYNPPVTLIEFATYQAGNIDFYDVSLVHGYNLPLTVSPNSSEGSRSCDITGCVFNFNDGCPDEFRVTNGSQGIIGCRNACDVFHTGESCCPNSGDCQRNSASIATLIFKKSCPRAYETSTFTCPSGTSYTVTFCPSQTLSRVVSEPAFQSIQPSTSPSPAVSPLAQTSSSTPKVTPFSNNFSHPPSTNVGRDSKRKHSVVIAVVLSTTALASILVLYGVWAYISKNKALKTNTNLEAYEIKEAVMDSLQFDLTTLRTATANFSVDNKLGEGGFGAVYKGKLENGQEIAVKRLSRNSAQGVTEFKTEVILVAKLRHKNLVKLLGYCVAIEEKILVYEFLPNSSLDRLLWDEKHKVSLDWSTRLNIIIGIARGLLYLHEDSPLKVIHRDLKPSNILLDHNMNPKISDFGLAKLFGGDQTQDDTKRIVGTYGYMAPEYATTGHYSVKSDIYSFGVIVLEIISGQRTRHFGRVQLEEALLHRAWRLWNEEKALDLVDATLCNNFSRDEMIKCIHIGLLCIQEDASVRPRMTSIVGVLNGKATSLPMPKPPNFFGTNNTNLEESRLQYNSPGAYSGTETITNLYSRD